MKETAECINCGEDFVKKSHNHKYCSTPCKRSQDNLQSRMEVLEKVNELLSSSSDSDEEDIMQVEFLQKENARLARQLLKTKFTSDMALNQVYIAARESFDEFTKSPVPKPKKATSPSKKHKTKLVPVLMLADFQTGKVTPTYNTEICRKRIHLLGEKVLDIVDNLRGIYSIDTIRLWALGDIVEGEDIFPGQTNLIDSSIFRQVGVDGPTMIRDGIIDPFLGEFDSVHFVGVIGNHGNLSGRFASKYNGESNMDRLLYQILSLIYEDEPRVTFDIPQGHAERNFYAVDYIGNYSSLLLHGDQFPAPTSLHTYYKKVMGWKDGAIPEEFMDVAMGHYHQNAKMTLGNSVLRICGSPESYNTFAQEVLAVMGRPSQMLLFVDPDAGEVVSEYTIYLDEV